MQPSFSSPTIHCLAIAPLAIAISAGLVVVGCSSATTLSNQSQTSQTQAIEAGSPVVISQGSVNAKILLDTSMAPNAVSLSSPAIYMPPLASANRENYQPKTANPIHQTATDAIATFSIDTDTGSYANVRRYLNSGKLPPTNAVRTEELINYFNYDFTQAKRLNNAPFLIDTETVASPWQPTNRLVKVAIKAADPTVKSNKELPPANLVFLIDTSGSMRQDNKLPLVKSSLKMLTNQLRPQDTISLVSYAGTTNVVLPATKGNETAKILAAIDTLQAQGSTNGEGAIKLAYQQARTNFKPDGINRILLMTDGDFNVGVASVDEMLDIIRRERDSGVSLSTFGFGTGNLNDHMMEQVADHGNGNYSYIDSLSEAKKVLVDELSATFNTVAKDVKVQVEFNPHTVKEWRLIGYENRVLATEDFNNDKVDAGELGAGKSVLALFEITPVGEQGMYDSSRYQTDKPKPLAIKPNELGYLKIRYKSPRGGESKLLEQPINAKVNAPSSDLQFATAVAGYGELLSQSKYIGNWKFSDSKRLAQAHKGDDPLGIRAEFIQLADLADNIK